VTAEQLEICIARIDERTRSMAVDLEEMKVSVRRGYVRRDEFVPVQRLVYGLVALTLTTVAGAVIALVIRS